MRKLLSIACLSVISLMTLAVAVSGQPKEEKNMTWTGWISDSGCAAKGMSAEHKECAIKCVNEKGAKWVFVNSKTKKVYEIHNQDAVNKDTDLGQEVKLTGHAMEDGSIHVEKIAPAM